MLYLNEQAGDYAHQAEQYLTLTSVVFESDVFSEGVQKGIYLTLTSVVFE